ncbi:MAG: hypothetical protein ACRC8A_13840 [Microcoleaceae cyanobacterium]
MRLWRVWWQTLVYSAQYNPPQFIEFVMLILALVLLSLWGVTGHWVCLVLCLSYAAGSSMAMLVREAVLPSARFQPAQAIAVLLLIVSLYTLAELVLQPFPFISR